MNFPGSWADGSLTARFLPFIKKKIDSYKIWVDMGFPRSGSAFNVFLLGPPTTELQDGSILGYKSNS